MLTINQQTVHVNRLEMIIALKAGLVAHQAQYATLRAEYEAAVVKFLAKAAYRAKKGDFTNLNLNISAPVDHSSKYIDIIEMSEVSVNDTVELDKESYKAYYKNQWSWSAGLEAMGASYKSILGGKR